MVARRLQCDRRRLAQLLDDALADPDERDVLVHLETCPHCRHELETLAAEPSWWTDAGRLLRPDAHEPGAATAVGDDELTAPVDAALGFLDPAENPALLGQLGPYDILEVIGRGGMGLVLKGYDRALDRQVAIKVLAPHLATSGAARRRFAREAQAAAAVVHPHVIAIHAVESAGKLPFLVMPLVAGQSLEERLRLQGSLELPEILRIGMQAAQGLAAAHAQGLVHRDVKPANMLLESSAGRVLLSDFGLARAIDDATMTHSGVIAGTPQFMSPEQAKGEPIDHRSDLFSLGSVLYAMATGRPPFRAETTLGILRRICDDQPRPIVEVNPDLPLWLGAFVGKLLAKDPAQRYGSAAEVAALLEQCLAHVRQPTALPLPESLRRAAASGGSHAPGGVRGMLRRPLVKSAVAALAVCTLLAAGWSIVGRWRTPTTAPRSHGGAALPTAATASAESPAVEPTITRELVADDIGAALEEIGGAVRRLEAAVDASGSDVEQARGSSELDDPPPSLETEHES